MTIETDRLVLRYFTLDDLDAFAPIMADPEVMRFSLHGPLTKSQTEELLKKRIIGHYAKFGFGLYAIIHRQDNCLVGYAGLMQQTIDGEEKIELGYRLAQKYWGRGLATEASLAICHHAFNHLNIDELIAIIDPQNIRSLEVAKRIGMYDWKDVFFHGIPAKVYVLKKLTLEPFQTSWSDLFEKEKTKLSKAFGHLSIEFFHIGSTAIPGCEAKPIVDILGVTSDITAVDPSTDALSKLGYETMGEYGMKQRRYFRRKHVNPIHLHIFEDSDPEVERHLRFISYLKNHPDKIQEYSSIKQAMVKKFPGNIDQYCLGKEKFIKKIDELAAQEASKAVFQKKSTQKKQHWSTQEIIKAIEVNWHLQMTYFTKYVNNAEIIFQPDATVVRSPIPDDNYVLSANFKSTTVNERVVSIVQFFKPNVPFSWWVGPNDTPVELQQALMSKGLSLAGERVGMYLELDPFKPASDNTFLDFQKVSSASQLKEFSQLVGKEQVDKIPLIVQPGEMFLAYLDGTPIAGGTVVLHANVGGIYELNTVPSQRGKGYGTAMLEHLIKRAKDQGYHLAILLAPKEVKIPQRLGFKECCLFKEYGNTIFIDKM